MSTENVEILVDSQTLRNLQAKRKKHMGVKQKLINKNKGWTEEMIDCLLDSLKRYNVICDFSGKDFDAVKKMAKKV